jgi:DNA-binding transcriptional LysR family regulator
MAIELRLLRCALALAEHRRFSQAARAIHVSQPVLSRSIQEIERHVGSRLFERTSQGVIPTVEGSFFLGHAREVVAREADLESKMGLLRGGEKGELHIGSGIYASALMVEEAVTRLVHRHPSIGLHIQNNHWVNLLPRLRKRELDIAVLELAAMGEQADLHVTRLGQHQGYFVVRSGHPLLASKEVPTLRGILKFPVVMSPWIPSAFVKSLLDGALGKNPDPSAVKSFRAITCESVAMMKKIAAGSDAVAVLTLNTVMAEVQNGHLAVLPLVAPWIQGNFVAVRLAHRSLSPLGETFVRLLVEVSAEVLDLERKNAPKLLAAPKRARSQLGATRPRKASSSFR